MSDEEKRRKALELAKKVTSQTVQLGAAKALVKNVQQQEEKDGMHPSCWEARKLREALSTLAELTTHYAEHAGDLQADVDPRDRPIV